MIVEVKSVSKIIDKKTVLKDITFKVEQGKIVGLIGPNGAGKTSIMKIMCGLRRPSQGQVLYNGKEIESYMNQKVFPISSLIETPSMYSYLSGYKNVKITARLKEVNKKELATTCNNALKEAGLIDKKNMLVKKYSLGMRQRLGIAMAILGDPEVIILDEPINGLDPDGIEYVRKLVLKLAEEGKIVIVSSHILSELSQICDSLLFVKNGQIVKEVLNDKKLEIDLESIYKQVMNGGN